MNKLKIALLLDAEELCDLYDILAVNELSGYDRRIATRHGHILRSKVRDLLLLTTYRPEENKL
jgi:hypothetical protein